MKDKILKAAVREAARIGYANLRRDDLALKMGIASGGITYHWKTMPKLQAAVIRDAIANENHPILAQAIVARHPLVKELPEAMRRRALIAAAA